MLLRVLETVPGDLCGARTRPPTLRALFTEKVRGGVRWKEAAPHAPGGEGRGGEGDPTPIPKDRSREEEKPHRKPGMGQGPWGRARTLHRE